MHVASFIIFIVVVSIVLFLVLCMPLPYRFFTIAKQVVWYLLAAVCMARYNSSLASPTLRFPKMAKHLVPDALVLTFVFHYYKEDAYAQARPLAYV